MNSAEVLIKFTADTKEVEEATKSIEDSLSSASKKVLPYSAAASGFITAIAKTGMEFEKAMANVQAISGATADEMKLLEAKAREMGKATIYTASESADALSYMALAGWKTNDMLEGLPGVLNLAAAGNTDLATTSDIVTDSLTAFKMTAADSTRLADVMAAAMSNSNTTIELLGESFKYAAPLAGTLGQSVEDTSFALGLMANAGIKGSQAGTSLRQVLSRLSTDTNGARTSLEKLGVEVFNSDGTMRDLESIIRDTQVAFNGLSKAQQTSLAKTIAGQTGMSGFLAMINSTEEDMNKLSDAIGKSSGKAQEMADVMNQSTSNQLRILWSEVQEVALQFAEALLPAIKNIVGGLQKVARAFQKLSPTMRTVIVAIAGILAAASPVLKIASSVVKIGKKVVSMVKGIISVVKALGAGLKILWGIMAANPIVLIVAAIVALIAIFVILWNKCKWFRDFFINMWNAIKNVVDTTIGFIVGLFKGIVDFVKNNWQGLLLLIVNPFVGAFKLLYDNCEGFRNFINNFIGNIVNFFKELPGKIVDIITSIPGKIKDALVNGVNTVKDGATKIFNAIKNKIAELPDKLKKLGEDMVKGIWNGIKGMGDWIKDKIGGFANGVVKGFKKAFGIHSPSVVLEKQVGVNLGLGVVEGIDDTQKQINKTIGNVASGVSANIGTNLSPANISSMQTSNIRPIVNVYADFKTDPLGQTVSSIKTFSGGAKNDYNYGVGV